MISSMTASSSSTRNTPKADSSFKGYDRIEEIILKKVSRNIRKDAFTIEEIYNQESELPSSLIVLPPSRLALTPRSKEACQRHGINPEVLRRRKPPELDGAKLEIDSMRYEAQTRVREEMIGLARKERERLVSMEEFIPYSAKKNLDKTVSLTLSSGETIVEKSTMEQIEEKRLAKIKRRQEKEIEQMITQKAKLQETFEETRAREEHLARKEEKRRRQEKRRERIVAEERRLKELQKRAQMQAERDLQARIAEKMQEIEEQTANERRKMEEQRLAKKREIEETKKKMSEAHKLRTERALAKKQECLRAKANKREQKERERLLKMNDQREKEKNAVAKIQEEKNLIMSANRKGAKLREKERKVTLLLFLISFYFISRLLHFIVSIHRKNY